MFKHYTMNQVVLPLDLEIKLQENDIAYAVNDVVESIPDEAFIKFLRFMAVNLRKYTAMNRNQTVDNKNNPKQNGSDHQKPMIGTIFQ